VVVAALLPGFGNCTSAHQGSPACWTGVFVDRCWSGSDRQQPATELIHDPFVLLDLTKTQEQLQVNATEQFANVGQVLSVVGECR
jgi:hypothetical protein